MKQHKIFSWVAAGSLLITLVTGLFTDILPFLLMHKLFGCIAVVTVILAMKTGYRCR